MRYTGGMEPQRFSQQASDYQRVAQAIRYLEVNFRAQPALEEIAASVHLSPYHFQRLFKRWAGVSPTQFLHYLTVEYAKGQLQRAESVLATALAAGLSGPGRLHDLFVTFEAMTPGEFKQQGAGLQIAYGLHETPFGRCLLAATGRGICSLYFVEFGAAGGAARDELASCWPGADLQEDPAQTGRLVEQIFAPAKGDRPFHLFLKGTNFQVAVWRALLAIPPGAMVSYQDVASYLGRPTATRAVGAAVGRNPISYLIPCHRVITSAGAAHRYRWGTVRKRAMLGWEASRSAAAGY